MRTGSRLAELASHRWGLAVSLVTAVLVAFVSVFEVSLSPPDVSRRGLEIGAASTQVLVDTPSSKIVDLDATYVDLQSLTARADLLGNVMASLPVRARIAGVMRLSPAQIEATAPITANVPRSLVEPGSGASARDIVASPERFKLQVQADPTVPILRIYTQAPDQKRAEALAAAAVTALEGYLRELADAESVPADKRVTLQHFGVDRGGVVNRGIAVQIALLTFVVTLALSSCAVLFLARVRRGWQSAAARHPAPG